MTNEFNFDVKHEDYKEWLNQIEQVSDADCSLLSEPDPYTKCVRSPEIQKSAAAKMDANGNIVRKGTFRYGRLLEEKK